MSTTNAAFEFHAIFGDLDDGLAVLHSSVDRLRVVLGRDRDDVALLRFETALGEIGSNVLTHGRPAGTQAPVDYRLRFDHDVVEASLTDFGAPVHEHLGRDMPEQESESGRGLAMARSLLDELGYERDGDVNRWRLVKRL
ncbi:MAG TPA: ATP-binding protein [Candidatus Dormibacteraeota bacterium]|nr:ATP-binding protein [Candidatus Dormibacteraeota bacterium]